MKNLLLLLLNKAHSTSGYVYAEIGFKNSAHNIVSECPVLEFKSAFLASNNEPSVKMSDENVLAYHILTDVLENEINHIHVATSPMSDTLEFDVHFDGMWYEIVATIGDTD